MSTEKNLQNIIALMQRDDSVDAPADSIRWANNLFRTRAAEPKPSFLKKIVAVLHVDLAPGTAAFGERSTGTSQVRQMLFNADENAVDVRIEPTDSGLAVRGQILGEGFAGVEVRLSSDAREFAGTTNELSEFRFDEVPSGRYELTIRGEHAEITLKSIDIE